KTTVPPDGLLLFRTVKERELDFPNLQLMEGRYYIQDLDAGKSQNIDMTHHQFEFTATDHETEIIIDIYAPKDNQVDESLPLL
ncbi:hypothetical protein ACPTIX_13855, partial [Enterococcus faecalis]|uniref:hypothetical protein n=1 Tax=Enterococcus faecalis TaxID=1351 RepID=UPI003CC61CF2